MADGKSSFTEKVKLFESKSLDESVCETVNRELHSKDGSDYESIDFETEPETISENKAPGVKDSDKDEVNSYVNTTGKTESLTRELISENFEETTPVELGLPSEASPYESLVRDSESDSTYYNSLSPNNMSLSPNNISLSPNKTSLSSNMTSLSSNKENINDEVNPSVNTNNTQSKSGLGVSCEKTDSGDATERDQLDETETKKPTKPPTLPKPSVQTSMMDLSSSLHVKDHHKAAIPPPYTPYIPQHHDVTDQSPDFDHYQHSLGHTRSFQYNQGQTGPQHYPQVHEGPSQYSQGHTGPHHYPRAQTGTSAYNQGHVGPQQYPQSQTGSSQYSQGHAGAHQYPQGHTGPSQCIEGHVEPHKQSQGQTWPSQYNHGHLGPHQYLHSHTAPSQYIEGHVGAHQYPQGHIVTSQYNQGHARHQYPQGHTGLSEYNQGHTGQHQHAQGQLGSPHIIGHTGPQQYFQGHTEPSQYNQGHAGPHQYPQGHTGPPQYHQGHTEAPQAECHTGPQQYPQGYTGPSQYNQGHAGPHQYQQGHTGPSQYHHGHAGPHQFPQGHTEPLQYHQGYAGPHQFPQGHTGPSQYHQGYAGPHQFPQGHIGPSQYHQGHVGQNIYSHNIRQTMIPNYADLSGGHFGVFSPEIQNISKQGIKGKNRQDRDMDTFKSDVIEEITQMGFDKDIVENTVEKIRNTEVFQWQNEEMVIDIVIELINSEQQQQEQCEQQQIQQTKEKKQKQTEVHKETPVTPTKHTEQTAVKKGKDKKKEAKQVENVYLCVKGLAEDISSRQDKFCDFLEGRLDDDNSFIDRTLVLFGEDGDIALAVVVGKIVVGSLKQKLHKKPFEGSSLDVCEVEPPTSIVVSHDGGDVTDKDIKEYFKDHSKSGGGHLVSCDQKDGFCIICFQNHNVVENVCQATRRHKIKGVQVAVTPRYESQFGEIWDIKKHKIVLPNDIQLTWIDHHIQAFIVTSTKFRESLNGHLKPCHAELRVCGDDSVCLACLLQGNTPNVRVIVKSWITESKDSFDRYITENVRKEEVICNEPVWEKLKIHLKTIPVTEPSDSLIIEEEEKYCCVVVGLSENVQKLFGEIVEFKNKIKFDLDRQSRFVTERKHFTPEKIRVLENEGAFKQANDLAEDLKVIADENTGDIEFTGVPEDVRKAQIQIYETLNQKIIIDVHELSDQQIRLILNPVILGLIDIHLQNKNIDAKIENIDGKIKIITSTEPGSRDALQVITSFTSETVMALGFDSLSVIDKPEWTNMLEDLKSHHKDHLIIDVNDTDGTVTITTTSDIHQQVLDKINSVIVHNTICSESLPVPDEGTHRFLLRYWTDGLEKLQNDLISEAVQITIGEDEIEVSGTKAGIKTAKSKILEEIQNVKKKDLDLDGPGISKVICLDNILQLDVIGDQNKTVIMFKHRQDSGGANKVFQDTGDGSSLKCKNGTEISLIVGDIADVKADVIVCTAVPKLDLSASRASNSLLKRGGKSLQEQCRQKYPNGIEFGEIAHVKGGNLHCQNVYFGSLPGWKSGQEQCRKTVDRFMKDCIMKAEEKGFTSIMFLSLGTGALGYPAYEVAEIMYTTIYGIDKYHSKSRLKSVGFVVHHRDKTTLQAFKDEVEKIKSGSLSSSIGGGIRCRNGTTISLVTGELATEKGDVIVCGSSKDLNLSSGKASNNLLQTGGSSLQKECATKYSKGIDIGQVAAIKGGNLKCKEVYLGVIPDWKSEQSKHHKTFWKFVESCLLKAHQEGYSTIVFPALGTGTLGYPPDRASHLMYDCVIKFDQSHDRSALKNIKFVLYHKDSPTISGFRVKEREILTSSFRGGHMSGLSSSFSGGIKCQNGTKLELVKGELAKEKGDVIVCGSSKDLNLSSGKASNNLLQVGGLALQKECTTKYSKGIDIGQVAIVKGGNLKCQEVYLGVIPDWKSEQSKHHKTLWKFVELCLLKAHEAGYSTIIFPALGTGTLGYPPDRAAHLMYDCVIKFDQSHDRSALKNVKFVLYHKDSTTISGFQQKEKEFLRTTQQGGPGRKKIKTFTVEGSIEKLQVDVVVCTVGPNLDLSKGKLTQALVSGGGPSLQSECGNKYPSGIQHGDVADIGAGTLPCQRIYLGVLPKYTADQQTAEKGLCDFVMKCLGKASSSGFHSIAIPAIGTGKYSQYPHNVVAKLIFQTVSEFEKKNPLTCIRDVRCVAVSKDKQSCQAFKFEEKKYQSPSVQRAFSKQKFKKATPPGYPACCNKVRLTLYSDSDISLDKTSKALKEHGHAKITKKPIHDPVVVHLPREECHAIENLDKIYPIKVKIDQQKKEIYLEGTADDILQVSDDINKILRECAEDRHTEDKAKIVAESIQWHFRERTKGEMKLVPYSNRVNLKLEEAYKKGDKSVEFCHAGKVYKVNLVKMHEHLKHEYSDKVDVIRREKMEGSIYKLPSEWDDMGKTEQLKLVELKSSMKEYKQIEKTFKDSVFQGKYSGTFTVLKIFRIQNKYLYQQFEAKKCQITNQNPKGTKNEQTLWHGTGSAAIQSINYHGFNRSYCATANDAWFGNGVYFANDAGYSCADWASRPDSNGVKYMYMVRVLTGLYCQGVKGMRVPAVRTGTILYDSAVETLNNPTEFIIFNDTQAYPQYMIHFKK